MMNTSMSRKILGILYYFGLKIRNSLLLDKISNSTMRHFWMIPFCIRSMFKRHFVAEKASSTKMSGQLTCTMFKSVIPLVHS